MLGKQCGGHGGESSEPSFLAPCPGAASPVSIWGLQTAPGTMLPEDKAGSSPGAAQRLRLLPHSFCPRFLSRTLSGIRTGAVCFQGSREHKCPPLSHPELFSPWGMMSQKVTIPKGQPQQSRVMEAAGEHQNWMTPHGSRTATSPALH